MRVVYRPIGVVRSPFEDVQGMPIQPAGCPGVRGEVRVLPRYAEGLEGLEAFSHIILIYHFHRTERAALTVVPFLDSREHGVFSTRAPTRPNGIGLSVVRLEARDGNILRVRDVDILNGTPLLDIKPYVPEFDRVPAERIGWYAEVKKKANAARSDGRFR